MTLVPVCQASCHTDPGLPKRTFGRRGSVRVLSSAGSPVPFHQHGSMLAVRRLQPRRLALWRPRSGTPSSFRPWLGPLVSLGGHPWHYPTGGPSCQPWPSPCESPRRAPRVLAPTADHRAGSLPSIDCEYCPMDCGPKSHRNASVSGSSNSGP